MQRQVLCKMRLDCRQIGETRSSADACKVLYYSVDHPNEVPKTAYAENEPSIGSGAMSIGLSEVSDVFLLHRLEVIKGFKSLSSESCTGGCVIESDPLQGSVHLFHDDNCRCTSWGDRRGGCYFWCDEIIHD